MLMQHTESIDLSESIRHALVIAARLRQAHLPYTAYIRHMVEHIDTRHEALHQSLYRLGHAGAWGDESAAIKHIWGEETGDEALAVALYALIRRPNDALACAGQWGRHSNMAQQLVVLLTEQSGE
jgi:DNA-binding transcriptional MocR family regulator